MTAEEIQKLRNELADARTDAHLNKIELGVLHRKLSKIYMIAMERTDDQTIQAHKLSQIRDVLRGEDE